MQREVLKCGRCDTINAPGRFYCIKCGNFLVAKKELHKKVVSVWEADSEDKECTDAFNNTVYNECYDSDPNIKGKKMSYVVKCPCCGNLDPAIDQKLPITCNDCGYFYQVGIDIPFIFEIPDADTEIFSSERIKESIDVKNKVSVKNCSSYREDDNTSLLQGPLVKHVNDSTQMRLLPIGRNGNLPIRIEKNGEIVGKDGSILQEISSVQLSICHKITGWYAQALYGEVIYNGVIMNKAYQKKLSDGDVFVFGKVGYRVEIS